jgi:hypothetical protein
MLQNKLDGIGCRALDWLMRQAAALRELAWLNRRMTAKGLASVVAFIAAHYGLSISSSNQVLLASLLLAYLGIVGRDKPKGRSS